MGFEPTCRLRDKTLSRRPRYDHFGTSPLVRVGRNLELYTATPAAIGRQAAEDCRLLARPSFGRSASRPRAFHIARMPRTYAFDPVA